MELIRSLLHRAEVPHFRQSEPHDRDAIAHALCDGVQRIVKQEQLDFDVSRHAPGTWPELVSSSATRLVVLSEFSENTIYGNPALNRAQRALHDALHLRLGADFTLASELRVAWQQAYQMSLMTGDLLAEWVYADLYASACHIERYGLFPTNQLNLVFSVMTTGQVKLS
jgi:hypothetical protein